MRTINSRDNDLYKDIKRLVGTAKAFTSHRLALLDGVHLVQTCIAANAPIRYLLLTEGARRNRDVQKLERQVDPKSLILISEALFRDLTNIVSPVGIAAVIDVQVTLDPESVVESDTLVLDGIQDAGNVGTMLRTAACAGVGNVVLGLGCAGAWTPKVLRAAQGAHFSLNIAERVNLAAWFENQTLPSIGADVRATAAIFEADLKPNKIWVFGSEGQGLSPVVKGHLTHTLVIPMASSMESLNVSSAAAICLYEACRQRRAQ